MKKLHILLLILAFLSLMVGALLIVISVAHQGLSVTRTGIAFSLSGPIEEVTTVSDAPIESVVLREIAGDVRILPSESGETKVVSREYKHTPLDVRIADGVLKIDRRDERAWYERIGFFFGSARVDIYLPTEVYTELDLSAISGDISVEVPSVTAECVKIRTTSGNITVKTDITDILDLKTTSGNIRVEGISDRSVRSLEIGVTSGNIRLTNVTVEERLSAEATSGNIRLERVDADTLYLKAVSGDIKGTLRSGKEFFANATSGDVHVPSSTSGAGRCEVRTSSGDIDLKISN